MKNFEEIVQNMEQAKVLLQDMPIHIVNSLEEQGVDWLTIKKTIISMFQEFYDRELELQKELLLASKIQQGSLPPMEDNWDGVHYHAYLEPMTEVSGDFFDVIKAKNFYKIIIADASGHGIPAALVTMAAKEAFRSPQSAKFTPKEFLKSVNTEICKRITTEDYLTGFILHFLNSQEFLYASAGHHPAFVLRQESKQMDTLDSQGTFIGALAEANDFFAEEKSRLNPGDKLVVYTDGLIEQRNNDDEIFGLDRFMNILHQGWDISGKTLLQSIVDEHKRFRRGCHITDDMTIIVVELEQDFFQAKTWIEKGKKYLRQKEYTEALRCGQQARALVNYLPEMNYVIAVSLYYLQRYEESLPFFRDFLRKIQFRMRTVGVIFFDALIQCGEYQEAMDFGKQILNEKMPSIYYRKMLDLAKKMGKKNIEQIVLNKLSE